MYFYRYRRYVATSTGNAVLIECLVSQYNDSSEPLHENAAGCLCSTSTNTRKPGEPASVFNIFSTALTTQRSEDFFVATARLSKRSLLDQSVTMFSNDDSQTDLLASEDANLVARLLLNGKVDRSQTSKH